MPRSLRAQSVAIAPLKRATPADTDDRRINKNETHKRKQVVERMFGTNLTYNRVVDRIIL